ncbi:MAG: glycosyltransferase [Candidatus Magasanikbacteria bacterium]|nr:glycosyltransferase [Candidatus Magasanikbacteria bacterium]
MKLSVHLVTWNGAKYVPFLFDSLRKQSFKNWELLVIDNNSTDGMVEAMKKELVNFSVQHELVENKTNLGFAGGHNMAFKKTNGEYILMLNQDMYLTSDCLEKVVTFLDNNSSLAVVSPRLMKWNFIESDKNLVNSFTNQIDTLGLQVYRNRRVVEQYTGQQWEAVKNKLHNLDLLRVFGVSGALPVFRRSALQEVVFPEDGTVFDESYHAYKEDVDLAYRMAALGLQAGVLLGAVAYHDRSAAGPKQASDRAAAHNKKGQSQWVKYHSYKNHLMTLYKNEYWQNVTLDFPWILWYELKKFVYFLIFDRAVLVGLREVWVLRKILKKKRNFIKHARKLNWREVRALWSM